MKINCPFIVVLGIEQVILSVELDVGIGADWNTTPQLNKAQYSATWIPTCSPTKDIWIMAAGNIPQLWLCGWPNSTSQPETGYTINPLPPIQALLPRPRWCGSFSVKNERPLEFTWTNANNQRVGARIVQDPHQPFIAHVTFHPVISVQDPQGYWQDICQTHIPHPVPHWAEFRILRPGIQQGLIYLPHNPLSYIFPWIGIHRFIIGGVAWEDFIFQVSVARSAIIGPLPNHNFRLWIKMMVNMFIVFEARIWPGFNSCTTDRNVLTENGFKTARRIQNFRPHLHSRYNR